MKLVQPDSQQLLLLQTSKKEDVKNRDRDLEIIKEWLRQTPHLPDTYEENALLNFLRNTKFSLETTKRKLDMYFTMRGAVPEFFSNRDVTRPELAKAPTICSFAVMPTLTPNARRITIVQSPHADFTQEDTINLVKLILMIGDIRLIVEEGVDDIYILDASCIQLKNLPKVSFPLVQKFFICIQEAYPVPIKEVHIVNASPIISVVIKWAARFIKDKIIQRIRVHENLVTLHECISPKLLPDEFGGSAGKINDYTKMWMDTLEEWGPWFKKQDEVKADETKRIDKLEGYESLFGVDGSFRKLNID